MPTAIVDANGAARRADARRRRGDLLQLPLGPDAPDRAVAHRRGLRRLRREGPSRRARRDDDGVRPDLHRPRRVPAAVDGAHRRRGGVGRGVHDAADGGNREVRARDLLLQRRDRDAVPGRGAPARAQPEGGDVRPRARDERARDHRRALRGDRVEASTTSCSATTRTATWSGTRARSGDDQGGGDGGPVPGARRRGRRAGGSAPAHHRGSRQLRDDDRSRRRAARTPRTRPIRCRSSSWTATAPSDFAMAARCATWDRPFSGCWGSSSPAEMDGRDLRRA